MAKGVKGVMVMGWVPEVCAECIFNQYAHAANENYCMIGDCKTIEKFDEKPEWCPIKILPEKLERTGEYHDEDNGTSYLNGLADGWNALMDLINGENEKEEDKQ